MQSDTPLGQVWLAERQGWSEQDKAREAAQLFDLTTRMYALARIMLGDVNIAATTALQVGSQHGAGKVNVVGQASSCVLTTCYCCCPGARC